tara:strand:- start:145 stop:303 length:159 start_codon:yes stop_codon:yes gene_type:complete
VSNKDITIKSLKEEKKQIREQIEHYQFRDSTKVHQLEDELFEVNDTIKKLNA